MSHDVTLITTLAAALGVGLAFGFIAARLKLPPLVGYLIAGVVIGPATPGFVADLHLSQQLAEIGVILLMFGVGLHFSLEELLAVRKIAIPGALVQIVVATALAMLVAHMWGWPPKAALLFGLALSVASTVVLLRALEDRGVVQSMDGHIAVGWLVVQDLAMVVVLVLLPAIAHPTGGVQELMLAIAKAVGQIAVFIALMLLVGRRVFPWLLWQVARTGSRELFRLCVIAAAVGIAFGSAHFFGVSFALGAFFAGMVLRESSLSYRAAEESLPLRDAFAVLFFVSVGMLFDPAILVREPWRVLAVLGIILLGNSIAAFAIILALRYPLRTALTVGAGLAQIGEFSFILAALGVSLGMLPADGQGLILAGALISIAVNPAIFNVVDPLTKWFERRGFLRSRSLDPLAVLPASVSDERLREHTVLAGYGRVGRRIAEALRERGLPFVVVEENREAVDALREQGLLAVSGDASDPAVLAQAHVAHARLLVVATPDSFQARKMLAIAFRLNPLIETVVRTHSDEEAALLLKEKAGKVFMGEHELAAGIIRHVLERTSIGADLQHSGFNPVDNEADAPSK